MNNRLFKSFVKYIITAVIAVAAFTVTAMFSTEEVQAKPLDEILNYTITVDVNEDATLDMVYEISWKVLDSKSEGPLEWVKIGIPNSHYGEMYGLTNNIRSIKTMNSGGTYVRIDFDRAYHQGEVVDFAFRINMDYMYQVYPDENMAEYTFTPGWFDDIAVDDLVVLWNSDKNLRFSPACLYEEGYLAWETSLKPKEKFTVTVAYPTDAYGFDLSKHIEEDDDDSYEFSKHKWYENVGFSILVVIFIIIAVAICFAPLLIPIIIVYAIYKATSGFRVEKKTQITRTIIDYYPSCPNCGGAREEGKEECGYCGTNMVKSRQVVKEKDLSEKEKDVLNFNKRGEYRYSDNPNRYVRVNVIHVPVTHSSVSRSSGSHHSSCAHSSCACACACACAGGGRAGCTTKDFYNTNFKMSYLNKYKK